MSVLENPRGGGGSTVKGRDKAEGTAAAPGGQRQPGLKAPGMDGETLVQYLPQTEDSAAADARAWLALQEQTVQAGRIRLGEMVCLHRRNHPSCPAVCW